MNNIAIIPARAGSKRLPNKNILKINGKSLIEWSINAALQSKYINKVIVSTDSLDIAEVARLAGAQVPFLRPKKLSTDSATTADVIANVIEYLEEKNEHFDNIVLLQPTSPLRTTKHIDDSIALFNAHSANSVISVTECEHSPLWCNTLPDNLSFNGFIKKSLEKKRSQDLPKYYRINGAIYIIKKESFLNEKTFFSKEKSFAFIMDSISSIDIDTKLDFIIAETIMTNYEFI